MNASVVGQADLNIALLSRLVRGIILTAVAQAERQISNLWLTKKTLVKAIASVCCLSTTDAPSSLLVYIFPSRCRASKPL